MDVVVIYKWSRRPEDARVRADGSVDWGTVKNVATDDDAAAIAAAVGVAGATEGSVTGVTIGDGDVSWALARGAATAVSVTDAVRSEDQLAVADWIVAGVRHASEAPALIVMGDTREHAGVAAAVAARLGLPALLGVGDLAVEDGRVLAHRTIGSEQETIAVTGPAIIGITARAAEKKAPGMKEMLAARKRPVDRIEVGSAPSGVVELVATREAPGRTATIFQGETAAADLVAALRTEGAL